jgi:DNA-binding CsgD family transcriptional regulator
MLRGRDGDLRALRSALAAGGAVVLAGEAGIGKTALLQTLARELDRPVVSAAYATLRWQPLFPLARVLPHRLGEEDAVAVAARVRSELGGRVLMLDDAHWADPLTQQVLPLLAGHARLVVAVRTGDSGSDAVATTLGQAGAAVHPLGRLAEDAATGVVRDVRPDLGPRAVAEVLRRAAGSPLLLTELAASGGFAPTLRRRVQAGLRVLSAGARADLELVAVVGHPLPVELVSTTVDELVAACLVRVVSGAVEVCHPMLAETCLELASGDRRRLAHARAAGLPLAPVERASHWAAAGSLDAAHRIATVAAARTRSPGERAALLGVAARTAPAREAVAARIAAAEAHLAAGLDEAADRILAGVEADSGPARFRIGILEARSAWSVGDDARSLAAVEAAERALAAVDPVELDVEEARLTVDLDRTRHTLLAAGDIERGLGAAGAAVRTARRRRSPQLARALYLQGTAETLSGDHAGLEHLAEAMRLARASGDHDLELRAGNNLVASHEPLGGHDAGREVARALVERAGELGLGAHVAQFRAAVANLDMLDGWVTRALETCDETLAGVVQPRTRDQLEVTRTIALLDLGRFEEARAQTRTSADTAADDPLGRAQFAYLEAEMELMVGRAGACVDLLRNLVRDLPRGGELRAFSRVTLRRALAAAGSRETVLPAEAEPWPEIPFFAAAPVEAEAFALLQAGRAGEAAARFDTASALWRPHYLRSSLYCAWQAGAARLRAGDPTGAVGGLVAAEALAQERAMAWQLAQVRRTLRTAGVRRPSPTPRARPGLTTRENEVLRLAATGVTNVEIAARLGLARRTVETHLASATAKMRAGSRRAAAAQVDRA